MQVVVVISGGNLVGLFANDPQIEVCVIDWDNINEGDTGSWIQPDLLEAMPEETREVFEAVGR